MRTHIALFLLLWLNAVLVCIAVRAAGRYVTQREWLLVGIATVVASAIFAFLLAPALGF